MCAIRGRQALICFVSNFLGTSQGLLHRRLARRCVRCACCCGYVLLVLQVLCFRTVCVCARARACVRVRACVREIRQYQRRRPLDTQRCALSTLVFVRLRASARVTYDTCMRGYCCSRSDPKTPPHPPLSAASALRGNQSLSLGGASIYLCGCTKCLPGRITMSGDACACAGAAARAERRFGAACRPWAPRCSLWDGIDRSPLRAGPRA